MLHHNFHQLISLYLHNKQFSIFMVNYFPYFITYQLSPKFFQFTFFPSINFQKFLVISSLCLHKVYRMNSLILFYIFRLFSSNYRVFFLFRFHHITNDPSLDPDLNENPHPIQHSSFTNSIPFQTPNHIISNHPTLYLFPFKIN